MQNIENRIREEAARLGFDLVGFSSAELPKTYGKKFKEWISQGKEAEMRYLTRRNDDSSKIFKEDKSVISLGVNYFRGDIKATSPNPLLPNQKDEKNASRGRVALYATTRDYHKIITKKLKLLAKFLEMEFGAKTRYYVDTGPIMERAYALEAGLGYIGRNTCLISREFGSWVFLAEIITDLDLKSTKKDPKLSCGTCHRCVDICPTGAINEDLTIDSKKCISYLTIENRGEIPLELREKVGNWLYGCDICQDVCPHNAKAKPTKAEEFQDVRIKDRHLDLSEILKIKDDKEFLEIFAGSPMMRAKRVGILRNACVVAGNSLDARFLKELKVILDSEKDEMLKEHASWAIQKIKSAQTKSQ